MSAVLWLVGVASMVASAGPQARERRPALGIRLVIAHDLEPQRGEALAQFARVHQMIGTAWLAVAALANREGLVDEASARPERGRECGQERPPQEAHAHDEIER